MGKRADSAILSEIFDFFLKHHFLTQIPAKNLDAMILDLDIQNKALIPDFDTTKPRSIEHVDMSAVNVFGEGILFEKVIEELCEQGFLVRQNPSTDETVSGIFICCSDIDDTVLFEKINKLSFEKKMPVLFAQLRSNVALIGPLVVPSETSCYACYRHRAAPHLNFIAEQQALQINKGDLHSSKSIPKVYALAATFHTVSQILKFKSKAYHLCLTNEVLEVNLLNYQFDVRPILRIPHCKVCYASHSVAPKTAVRSLV